MFVLVLDYILPKEKKQISLNTYSREFARSKNKEGYGVFATPNKFHGRRILKNLEKIRWAFFEVDGISKDEQMHRISNSPIRPSRIIESKNSYHVYFRLADECSESDFKFIQEGLIAHFNSDRKIKDATRLLRVPGFYNMKDPMEPFMVKTIIDTSLSYSVREMKAVFPYTPPIKKEYLVDLTKVESGSLEEFLAFDCQQSLRKLSGTPFVNYEQYTFRRNGDGSKQIAVNGKPSSCFVDERGLIGATHGPTVWQWLRYFGHSDSAIRRIIKDVFNV